MPMDKQRPNMDLRVAADTDTRSLGWSIRCNHLEGKFVRLKAVGVGAVLVAAKAVAVANGHLAPKGVTLLIFPVFDMDVDPDKPRGELTVMRFDLMER